MFTVHRSERSDALVDALAAVVTDPMADPFTAEVVAVPTRGVERWLTHRLSSVLGAGDDGGDGVCANVTFPFPGRLVGDVLAEATGVDRELDPWRPERLVWPLLEVIDSCATDDWCRIIGEHIGAVETGDDHDELRRDRRFGTARHVATLFDRYATYRPSMISRWLDDDDDVPADEAWQPELYRRLAAHVESTQGVRPPPARLSEACTRLADDPSIVTLPERLALFGLTHIPASHRAVMDALAEHRQVHLFALHPSRDWWERVAAVDQPPGTPRAQDETRRIAEHPLLRNWADDAREMQLVLSSSDKASVTHHPVTTVSGATLLGRLQADIRADEAPAGARPGDRRPVALDAGDRSVQVHACHGRLRQVEIVRDAICHLLADDETLEPRDVIVMCPDIDEFAPVIEAVFGATVLPGGRDNHDPASSVRGVPHLPYRLADRALRRSNPLLDVLAELLDLVRSRLTADDVLAFASRAPVRDRFAFDDDALDQLARWIGDSGVRWGLDPDHRAPWALQRVRSNTWRSGLDRLLLGVTMDETGARLVEGVLPVDDVDSGQVDLVGAVAEFVDRLDAIVRACATTRSLDAWVQELGWAMDLLTRVRGRSAWQRAQLDRLLRDALQEASDERDLELSVTEVATLLTRRLEGAPTRTDFRTGAVTLCTLHPMRAVPHRVVCVIGLDADAFPRLGSLDGHDLLRHDPRIGDHDPRTEDRQLLLDALLSAEEHLVLTYSARDERTNEPRPPAVPLAELLDVLDDTASTKSGEPVRAAVVRSHPLQPFAPDNFDPGAQADGRPWSFDRTHLAGAAALRAGDRSILPFLDRPLPALTETEIDLEALVRFFQHPVREFLRQRLDATTWDDDAVLPTSIPYELDGLEEWRVGTRLLDHLVAGSDLDAACAAERVRGLVPPDVLGDVVLARVRAAVEKLHARATAVGASGPSTSVEIDVRCAGVRIVGTVADIRDHVHGVVSYSSTKPKDRLAAWVRLLALSATRSDVAWEATILGKRNTRVGPRPTMHHLAALDGSPETRRERALELLGDLVALRARGLCAPLPLPCATGEAWMTAERWKRTPEANARREWVGSRYRPGERADAAHVRVFGADHPFERLVALEPDPGDEGPRWSAAQTTRLGRLAHHVWAPLLEQESER